MEEIDYLELRRQLEDTSITVMSLRGIPLFKSSPEDNEITQGYLLSQLNKFKDAGKQEQDLHNLRVHLVYSRMIKLLGLRDLNLARSGQIGAIGHDFGKLMLLDLVDKPDFNDEDFEKMKKHSEYSAELLKADPVAARIALLTHYWQPPARKYPQHLNFKISPLERTLSIALGIVDFTDKAFNTQNSHLKRTQEELEEDFALRQGYPSEKKVKTEVLKTYGGYHLQPHEDIIFSSPKVRDLIEQAFAQGIFDLSQKH